MIWMKQCYFEIVTNATKNIMPLLISVNLLTNISLVAIFVQSKNLLSEIRVKSKTFGDRAKLWNKLQKNIRSITDFDKFKSMLKTHLLDNY